MAKRPSKAERQRRNRAQRDARAAKSANAGEATELWEEIGDEVDESGTDDTTQAPTRGKGSKKDPAPATGRARKQSPFTIPGQRAVILAFLFTIASVGLLIFTPVAVERVVPADDPRVEEDISEDDVDDDGNTTIVEDVKLLEEESLPVALLVMLTPVAITGAAAYYTKHPKRSTIWTMAMLGLAGYVFFIGGAYSIYTLPALVALGVGGFQARREENKERIAELKAQKEARKAERAARGDTEDDDTPTGGPGLFRRRRGKDVIDVDAVEDDD